MGIGMPNGADLTFSEKDNNQHREKYTRIQSESGQKLVLSDSGKQVVLDNGQQDGVTITNDEHQGSMIGPRSIQSKCNGNNYVYSEQGWAEVKSSGFGTRLLSDGIPNQFIGPRDGEVFIESQNNDIIINVESSTSRIFIDARGSSGMVQVRAGTGGVSVFSDGPIDLNSDQDVNINAGGDINLQGNNINLNQGQFSGKTSPTSNNKDIEEGS